MAESFKVGEAPWEVEQNKPKNAAWKVGQAPWETAPEPKDSPVIPPVQGSDEGAPAAALQGFGQGGTLGYLPQAQAGVAYGLERVLPESLGGGNDTYEVLKKQFEKRNQALEAAHPIATTAGNIAGAVATLPAGGELAEGASLAAKAGRAAGVGAGYGALANPEGAPSITEDPYANLKARLQNAVAGGATGGIAEGTLAGLGAGLEKWGGRLADKTVVKQIGANANQIKNILKKDELPTVEGLLVNENLMKPGTTLEDVAGTTKNILNEDGPKIGQLYDKAQTDAQSVANSVGVNSSGVRISGPDLADEIMSKVKSEVRTHPNRDAVLKEMESSLQPLRDMGDNANIKDIHEFRKGLDENIDWTKSARERPVVQDAYVTARNMVADKAKNTIDNIDKATGGNQLDLLKKLNDRYSAASTVNNISTQGVARETAKAFMGHGVIGAGAGTGAGYLEYQRSHDPLKAAAVGLGTAMAVTGARRYAPPLGYYGGNLAEKVGEKIGQSVKNPGRVGAAAASPWFMLKAGNQDGR